MRHTCASHWLALKDGARFENSEGLGNSEAVLNKHYRSVEVSEEGAYGLLNIRREDIRRTSSCFLRRGRPKFHYPSIAR